MDGRVAPILESPSQSPHLRLLKYSTAPPLRLSNITHSRLQSHQFIVVAYLHKPQHS